MINATCLIACLAVAACDSSALPVSSIPEGAAPDLSVTFAELDFALMPPDLTIVPDLVPDPCADGVLDGMETDRDCGGGQCMACTDGLRCKADGDCANRNCRLGTCRPATACKDGVKSGMETDIDCGGPDCACAHCSVGAACLADNDCTSGLCKGRKCVAPTPLTIGFGAPTNYPVGQGPRNIAVGDWNGDGALDFASTSDAGPVRVYLGAGDGTFKAGFDIDTKAFDIWTADFNGDKHLDLAVNLYADSGVAVFLGTGNGGFGAAIITPVPNDGNSFTMTTGDLNGDGKPDLYIPDWGGGARVLLGNGKGGFNVVVVQNDPYIPATRASIADLDCDGRADVLQGNGQMLGILLGDGKGGFSKVVGYPWFGMAMGAGSWVIAYDLHRSGMLDIVDSYGSVFPGRGDGTFGTATQFPLPLNAGWRGFAVADFNRDGNVDLVGGEEKGASIHLYPGTGPGVFGAEVTFPGGTSGESITAADFNRDGLPDLVISDYYASKAVVLLNQSK